MYVRLTVQHRCIVSYIETIHLVDSPTQMYRFYVSDAAEKFKDFANSILPFDIKTIEQINIEKY